MISAMGVRLAPLPDRNTSPIVGQTMDWGHDHRRLPKMISYLIALLMLLLISATSVSMSREEDVEDGGLTIKVETLPVGTL